MAKPIRTVTRADLVDAVYALEMENRFSVTGERLPREDCAAIVESVIDAISDALVAGETVKLSGFGAFTVREKAERLGRNPKTGEEAPITARRVPTFRASNVMKDTLNRDAADAQAEDGDEDDEAGAPSKAAG